MCGIAGIVRLRPGPAVGQEQLERMLATMLHRGPDDSGIFLTDECGLGARRLSIVDLTGGHQPMVTDGGHLAVVQNGEIYNYPALRRDLTAAGCDFHTTCDTEVLLHAYRAWGLDMVGRLRGMIAFALWDAKQAQLLLARDRFGIKPLYFVEHQGVLRFASTIQALLADPTAPRRLNTDALHELLIWGFVPGPQTLFHGIFKVPPAHLVIVQTRTGQVQQRRYWDLPTAVQSQAPRTTAEASARLFELLRDAVASHLQSDVPVGALLSGGLDSSGLVALMRRLHGQTVHTFSIGFEVPGAPQYNERPFAELAARHLGSEHHAITFTLADFDLLPAAVSHLEQPLASATFLPLYRLYAACHAVGIKVILTGEGADELFAGYGWYRGERLAHSLERLPAPLRRQAGRLPGAWLSLAARRVLALGATADLHARYQAWQQIGNLNVADLLNPDLHTAGEATAPLLHPPASSRLGQMQALEAQTRLPDFINAEVDSMSMAHSVEARVPYLDHHLWEAVMGWPEMWRQAWGQPEKWLLRKTLAPLLPAAIVQRRKQGLASPHSLWWQQPRLPAWATDAISSRSLRQHGLFQAAAVADLLRRQRAGQPGIASYLTAVLSTQVWTSTFRVSW
ncbi:MAG: asparagine synthase (glutamine-hydrolyzing) [Anaerolineae bacterium]